MHAGRLNELLPLLARLQLEALQARMEALFPAWVGFCHNDLQVC